MLSLLRRNTPLLICLTLTICSVSCRGVQQSQTPTPTPCPSPTTQDGVRPSSDERKVTVSGEAGRLLDGGDLKGAAALVRVIEFDRQPPGWKGNESRFPRTSIKQVATEDTSTTPPTTRVFFNHASDAPNRACTLTFWKTENEVFKDQVLRIEEKQGRRAVRTIVTIIKRDKWDESVWSRNPAYESDDDDVAYDAIMVVCPKTPTAPEVVKSCTDHCDRVVATLAKN